MKYHFRHFVKGIKNRIHKASKLASCLVLKDWQRTIVNMLWWSLGTAKGKKKSQGISGAIMSTKATYEKVIMKGVKKIVSTNDDISCNVNPVCKQGN